MILIRRFTLLCLLTVIAAIATFAMTRSDPGAVLVAGVLAILSWFITEGPRGRTLPHWVSNLLVIAVTGMMFAEFLSARRHLPDLLGQFCLWLIVIKLYDRRCARDHAHLLSLSLVLVLASCMTFSPGLLLGFLLLVYAILFVQAALLYQLHRDHEDLVLVRRRTGLDDGAQAITVGSVQPTTGRRFQAQFRGLSVGITGVGLLISLIVFLSVPRGVAIGIPGLDRGSDRQQVTGFSEDVRLLSSSRLSVSRRPVFSVRLREPDGRPVRLPTPIYFRGAVLEVYERGIWRARSVPHEELQTPAGLVLPIGELAAASSGGQVIRQEFRFERPTPNLFSIAHPVALRSETPRTVRFAEESGILRFPRRSRWIPTIEIDAWIDVPRPLLADRARRFPPAPASAASVFADPSRDEYQALRPVVEEILRDSGVPPAPTGDEPEWTEYAAHAIGWWLQSGRFRYTLDLSGTAIRPGIDPVVQFVLETRAGHCEYFASAFAALCRVAGIDARVVTGWVAHRFDPVADAYFVDQSAAHAWAEFRAADGVWIEVDPTPPGAILPAGTPDPTIADRFGRFYSVLEGAWQQHFVGYDRAAQARLFEVIEPRPGRGVLAGAIEVLRERLDRINRAFHFGNVGYIWMAVVALVVVTSLVILVRWSLRLRSLSQLFGLGRLPLRHARRRLAELAFYPRVLHQLARIGRPKPPWMPPDAFAERLAVTDPGLAAPVREIVAVYYAARFGGRSLTDEDRMRVEELLQQISRFRSARPAR